MKEDNFNEWMDDNKELVTLFIKQNSKKQSLARRLKNKLLGLKYKLQDLLKK